MRKSNINTPILDSTICSVSNYSKFGFLKDTVCAETGPYFIIVSEQQITRRFSVFTDWLDNFQNCCWPLLVIFDSFGIFFGFSESPAPQQIRWIIYIKQPRIAYDTTETVLCNEDLVLVHRSLHYAFSVRSEQTPRYRLNSSIIRIYVCIVWSRLL